MTEAKAMASPAMAWLRRYRAAPSAFSQGRAQSLPLIVWLRFDPDPISATALRREDPRAGTVHVHFPRIGYVLKAAQA